MPMILEFFPPVVQALNLEVQKHPLLLAELSRIEQINGTLDMEHMVGAVAAYCDVILDGYYMEEDLIIMFHMLLDRLRKKSTIHVH